MSSEIDGTVEHTLQRTAWRFSVVSKTVVVGASGLLGVLVAPANDRLPAAVVVILLSLWIALYASRISGSPSRALLCGELVVIAFVCLSQRWTVPSEAVGDAKGWALGIASFTMLANQWHRAPTFGVIYVLIIDAAFTGGALLASRDSWAGVLVMTVWLVIQAGMSRLLWILLRRGGRKADALARHGEHARTEREVALRRRAAEREHSAMLHDTAASTLLMVGLGEVSATASWLRDQARKDLAALDLGVERRAERGAAIELVAGLRRVIAASTLHVSSHLPERAHLPSPAVAALCGSVREALRNVARHAGVSSAVVWVDAVDERIVVQVTDNGQGFTPEEVPPSRRGISGSIIDRMAAVDGRAEVMSTPGGGTTVRLEWSRG